MISEILHVRLHARGFEQLFVC